VHLKTVALEKNNSRLDFPITESPYIFEILTKPPICPNQC